ncbi:ABC transporter ATP-binding protein [bacterium]|nr:ABC transporter ATP-binding protein [bacterium]
MEKIRINDVSKQFNLSGKNRVTTLKGINLSISEGSFVVILGRSGCGKSTLLNILAGIISASEGEVFIDGQKVMGTHPSRSILFQEPSLLPWLTVEENISFGCRIRDDLNNLDERVQQYINMINLNGFERHLPSELSVGMSQRVCLARAFIGNPDILLMDEPFGALDTFTRGILQEELVSIWKRQGFTVIFVTHDIEEAILLGTRVVLMGDVPGRIIDVFDVDLPYPKDTLDDSFLQIKKAIMEKFRESMK